MRHIQYLSQTTLIAITLISAPVAADPVKLSQPTPTVQTIAASLHNTLEVLIPRPITPANSGIMFLMGRSDQADFTAAQSNTEADYADGNSNGDLGASMGYRKSLSSRWSVDAQFERQSIRRSKPSNAPTPGTIAQASEAEISQTIAYWASMTAMYHVPITPKISVHAGGGAFVWQRKNKTSTGEATTTNEETDTNVLLQMGLGYRVAPRAKIEGNVQRFFMPHKAINRVSLGVVIQTD